MKMGCASFAPARPIFVIYLSFIDPGEGHCRLR